MTPGLRSAAPRCARPAAACALLCALLLGGLAGCGLRLPSGELVATPELRIVRLSVASANVFVVEQNGKRLMIDAGNPGDEIEYERGMREHGIDPASLDYLLLTHAHTDHAGTAAYFKETYGIRVIGGAADRPLIESEGRGSEICSTSLLARLILWSRSGMHYESFQLDTPLDGPFDLATLGMEGVVLPSPGHTPGSVVAVIGGHAFVGDLIRGGLLQPESPQTHFFMCDLAENRTRIRELLARDGIVRWHPAHFGPLEVDAVREYLAGEE
jgi:glyoxylase-like metal-dependent hydrolase (beta-lactamase superfamily II)